jgi:ABC-2 type transport system permease protein
VTEPAGTPRTGSGAGASPPSIVRRHRGANRWSLAQLTSVRVKEFVREPEAMFWTFIFPVLLTAGLGIAFKSRPADRAPVGVVAERPGADSLLVMLRRDPELDARPMSESDARAALASGDITVLAEPDGPARVTYVFDSVRSDARVARLLVDRALQRGSGAAQPVEVREEFVSERGARYVDFLVPGLLGMNLMGSGIWGIGFSIVDARKRRFLKRLVATPMSRGEYLAAYLFSRLGLLVAEVVVLVGFGALVFGVPLRGPIWELALIVVLSALAFGGLGLLLASRADTTEGVSGLMNLAMLPMWIFSGVFFASSKFPHAIQPFIHALLLTAVNDALRANMLRGVGLGAILPELAVIGVWLVACFGIALRLFRWR